MGPLTIFDKSALQSLNMDESVWLDTFFLVNVVPLFYVETLADLEKDVAEGKSPEDLVGMLAAKTPPNSVPNVHHRSLMLAELLNGWPVPMDGQVPIAAGDVMRGPDGEVGIHIQEFDEAVALARWKNHEFLEIEREMARRWRDELVDPDRDRTIGIVRNIIPLGDRIPELAALKDVIDRFCGTAERETLALAFDVLNMPDDAKSNAFARWEAADRPPLEQFAPYTMHVFKVDLLYYLGVDRGFIAGERASNKADMAYLYYLPFCMVFTSGDNLHRRAAPLLMRANQSFVEATAFKAALRELDEHYDRLPNEIKALGVMAFAHQPPADLDNLVVQLWDHHAQGDWRQGAETPEEIYARRQEQSAEGDSAVATIRERLDSAEQVGEGLDALAGDPDYVVIARQVPVRKGKWRLVPEDAEMPDE